MTDCANRPSGSKSNKARVTVLIGCSMAGAKLPLLVIGKSRLLDIFSGKYASPRCLRSMNKLPCSYESSKNAWMTRAIFTMWLTKLNTDMVRTNRKIIIFLDNAAPHHSLPQWSNIEIKLVFLIRSDIYRYIQPNQLTSLSSGRSRATTVGYFYNTQLITFKMVMM